MYDELIKRLREVEEMLKMAQFREAAILIEQAADAIEELQKLNYELLFRCSQAEALIDYYQTGKLPSNELPKESES